MVMNGVPLVLDNICIQTYFYLKSWELHNMPHSYLYRTGQFLGALHLLTVFSKVMIILQNIIEINLIKNKRLSIHSEANFLDFVTNMVTALEQEKL